MQPLASHNVEEAFDFEAHMPNHYNDRRSSDAVTRRAGLLKYDDDAGLLKHDVPHALEGPSSLYLGPGSTAMASMSKTPMHTPPVKPLPGVPRSHQAHLRPRSGVSGSTRKSRPNHGGMQQALPHENDMKTIHHAQVSHSTEHAQVTFNPRVSYMRASDEFDIVRHEIAAQNLDAAAQHRHDARDLDSKCDTQEQTVRRDEHASNTFQYADLGDPRHDIAHVPQDVISPHSIKPGAHQDHSMSREPGENWKQQGKAYAKQDATAILSLNQSDPALVEWTPSPVIKVPADSISYANIPLTTASHPPRRSLPPTPHGDTTPEYVPKSKSRVVPNGNGWTPNQSAQACSEVIVQRRDDIALRYSLEHGGVHGSGKENEHADSRIAQDDEAQTRLEVHRAGVLMSNDQLRLHGSR
jgi:hypothetical protein